jgi:PmbA protein
MTAAIQLIDPKVSQPELEQAVEQVLAIAKRLGASDAVAAVTLDRGMSVTARMGEVETVEMQADRGVSVTVFRQAKSGQHKGSASTSDLSTDSLEKTVAAALQLATYTEADDCAGLAEAEEMATVFPELDLYHPWEISTEQAIAEAIACEKAALESDQRICNSDGATVSTGVDLTVLGNSRGFSAQVLGSGHSLSCAVLAEDAGEMQRDYAWRSARDASELAAAAEIGKEAAERSLQRLGARSLKTAQVPVLFDRRIGRGLFSSLFGAISGGAQYRRNSFLLDSVGQQVLPEWLSLSEHPQLPKGPRSAPFDMDAVATREQHIIKNGVIQQYLLGVYSARKLGLKTTANAGGARNVRLTANANTQAELLAEMGTGFWVTELMGQGVNPVTGDYSRGASGFWVENGVAAYPVDNVTVAGNLKDIFLNIRALSADAEANTNIACGAVLIDGMMVAGG